MHVVGEDAGARRLRIGVFEQLLEFVAVENIVAKDQGAGIVAQEFFADEKGLRQPVGAGLHGVLQIEAPLGAVAQQLLEAGRVLRCGDDEDLAYARQHQRAERVVDHRFVEDRQQLFGNCQGGGVQAGA